jgi:hypothetical protein
MLHPFLQRHKLFQLATIFFDPLPQNLPDTGARRLTVAASREDFADFVQGITQALGLAYEV